MPRSSGSGSFLLRAGDWAERSWKMVGSRRLYGERTWNGVDRGTAEIRMAGVTPGDSGDLVFLKPVTGYSKKREDVEWCRNAVLRSSPSPLNT